MAENAEKPESSVKSFKLEDVAKHNTEKDCWIVVNGKVLDITAFLSQHPGGDDILLQDAGKDLSSEFEDTGHSTDARKQMEKYVVGVLEGASAGTGKSEKKSGSTVAAASGDVNPAVLVAILIAILAALFLLMNP